MSDIEIKTELRKASSFATAQFKALFTFGMGCTAFYSMAYQFSLSQGLNMSSYDVALAVVSVLSSAMMQDSTKIEEKLKNKNWTQLRQFLALVLKAGLSRIGRGVQTVLEILSFTAIMVPFFTILKKIFELTADSSSIIQILLGIALATTAYTGSVLVSKLNKLIQ
jgi:hypothetical protein